MNEKSALIAMSGGVDSSVAAYLTKKAGYECAGATMRLYDPETALPPGSRTCCSTRDIHDADDVAFILDIPFEVVDFTDEFRERVIDKFVSTYESGGTPNPCIDCNRYLKFSRLLEYAREKGLNYIVTGHYARIEYDGARGRWLLKKALDETKDQSYVLYSLTQYELAHTLLPLGSLKKSEVRGIAEREGFINAKKHDSQDICFVPDGDYAAFLERYTGKAYPGGDYLDLEGKKIGTHRGAVRYTVGQRRGLDLPMGERVYVISKDMEKNTVTVGQNSDLFTTEVLVGDVNFISIPELTAPMRVQAKTRYRQKADDATLSPNPDGTVTLTFDRPQRAVTRGQAAVFYDGDEVAGGGTIIK